MADRRIELRSFVAAALMVATIGTACAERTVVPSPSPTPPPSSTAVTTATPIPAPTASPPRTGDAEFFFEPGPMMWCGVYVGFKAPTATLSGELTIGQTTFSASSGNPAPFAQRFLSDVRGGSWACISGTIARSETTANLMTDFTVDAAPVGSMPPGPIRATPCGLITDVFVMDLPAGGVITLNGTKFLVGGVRPAGDAVQMTPSELRVGVSVCIIGSRLTPQDPATFTAIGGRVTVMR